MGRLRQVQAWASLGRGRSQGQPRRRQVASTGRGQTGGTAWVLPSTARDLRPSPTGEWSRPHLLTGQRTSTQRPRAVPSASRPLHPPSPCLDTSVHTPAPAQLSCLSLWDTFPAALNQDGRPLLRVWVVS